jgi:flavin reductase (DIM6/NTAB) family NADH-FMN oxidoreductase RutF
MRQAPGPLPAPFPPKKQVADTLKPLADGTHNIMTIGFHMVIQHKAPPLIGISLGPWDASLTALKEQRQCVLTVPSVEMAEVVVDIGNCSKDDEDLKETSKWDRFGLDALPAEKVKAPLVGGAHAIANIECVVKDTKMVASCGMWVLKPVKAWINPNMKPGEGGRCSIIAGMARLWLMERSWI